MAQVQPAQQRSGKSNKGSTKSPSDTPLQRCIDTWDRSTQMTKEEWRETCKRTTKEYPTLFNKPY